MTLEELVDLIDNSKASDWEAINRPIFAQDLQEVTGGSGHWIEIQEHQQLLVCRKDLRVSIARGLPRDGRNNSFDEPWATNFPDKHARASWIDFRYNSMPVFRDIEIDVDGGRASLPMPRSADDLEVPERQVRVWRLIDEITGAGRFDEYFRRAGLKPVATDWP